MRTLSIDSPRVTEGGTAVFTVSLDAPSVRTITVDFTTVPGTATADVDYQTTAGTLTFPPGALTQSIVVPVSGNPVDEPNETFKVVLSNPVNARIAPRQGPLAMTWTQLGPTPPFGPAYNHTRSVYDAGTDRLMVVQSGYSSAWVLENALANDAASRWRQLSPSGPAPVGREWAAVAFDAGSNRLILHGGTPSGRETWLLSGANGLGAAQWIRLPDYPGNPHWQMAPAYDAGTNRLIVFGGTVPDVGHTTETWVLKDANGNVVFTDNTDANGQVHIEGLTPGTYKLSELVPAGYQYTGAQAIERSFTITSGQELVWKDGALRKLQ